MSIHDSGGWGEVERKAKAFEAYQLDPLSLVTITTEDRLRGAIVESLSLLEQGHVSAAHNVLSDALRIK